MALDIALVYILLSTLIISLIAFNGAFTLSSNEVLLRKMLLILVSLSAGTMIGGAFIHLLPEAAKVSGSDIIALALVGFVLFFIIERVLMWHHCHDGICDEHTFSYMNLMGDGIHSVIDGLIIAASFVVSIPLGIAAAVAIAFHEIPQEIADFGVLVYAGFSKKKALLMNFGVALATVVGGVVGYFIASQATDIANGLLPFAAGGFIYIAATDLVPEIKKETALRKSVVTLLVFILGIVLMYLTKIYFGG
jgi:zinc and cadmium transporter